MNAVKIWLCVALTLIFSAAELSMPAYGRNLHGMSQADYDAQVTGVPKAEEWEGPRYDGPSNEAYYDCKRRAEGLGLIVGDNADCSTGKLMNRQRQAAWSADVTAW